MPSTRDGSSAGTDTLKILTVGTGTSIWLDDISSTAIFNPLTKITRNTEFYSGGSYLHRPGSQHVSYLLTGTLGRVVEYPSNYSLVYAETSPIPLYLWKPQCSNGFLSLGLYATNVDVLPVNETVCINEKFTISTSTTWRLARWDSNWDNVLWEAGKSPECLNMNSFTYTTSLTVNPPANPRLISLEAVKVIKQNYLTSCQLSRIGVSDDVDTITCSHGTRNLTSLDEDMRKLEVTSRWWLQGLDLTVDTTLIVDADSMNFGTGVMSGVSRYKDIILGAAQTANMIGIYYTFPFLSPTLAEFTAPDTYLETWVDVKFTGLLTCLNEKEEVLISYLTNGVLNLVIRDPVISLDSVPVQ